ncbi:MAG TPA: alkaline phosphatase family protein [Anaeromyxobacteraceae bacterium]|nr:alkaline phosphatase family protein [Anaeromyxobacteraceae bacterium]
MAAVFVFVDGVGAGANAPDVNPLARGEFLLSRFADGSGSPLPRGGRAALADATLGVPGRPQSATGQSTLLTGENAPRHVGRHLLGFPNARLRELLRARSIFRTLAERGRRGAFANAYPVAYLRALGLEAEGPAEFEVPGRRARASATTVAYAAGGGRFRTWADARRDDGLPHDLTGARARAHGASLPERDPREAAEILAGMARAHDLTVFEFFETDEAGHARSMERALDAIGRLDAFLRALVAALPEEHALLVASDHGNVEDLGTRNHTLARVPVLGFGPAAREVGEVHDLTHLAPILLRLAGADGTLPDGAAPR